MFKKKIKFLQDFGFEIDFSIRESLYYINKEYEDQGFYCSLYLGDSNAPWKPGTFNSCGYGESFEESLSEAIKNLEVVGNKSQLVDLLNKMREVV